MTSTTWQQVGQPASEEKLLKTICPATIPVVLLLGASIGVAADKDAPLPAPRLSADYAKVLDLVLPSSSERTYRKIDWRTCVLRGIVDAQQGNKPVMIVLMNGHPLGCT
jgi:hypothetical protein